MIPQQTFESYPVFGDNATKIKPDDAKYAAGFQQSDVLPAEWMNWAWGKNTKGITDLNRGMTSVETEILNVLTAGGQTPAEATGNQLLQSINYLIGQAESRAKLAAHPIGSLYWSGDSTDPGQLFGGTWSPVKDCFVWAKGDNDTPNAIGQNAIAGGAKTVTLETANLPSHSHTIGGSTGSESSHTHNMGSHTHTLTNGIAKVATTLSSTKQYMMGDYTDYRMSFTSGTAYLGYKTLGTDGKATSTISGRTDGPSTNTTGAGSSHSHTLPANTGSTGSGTAVDKMPPYIIKYCWERTA